MGGLRDVGLGHARDREMRAWPELGRGCLSPPPPFWERRRVRDWGTGWVHAGWGKGGTDLSGLLWLFATPNFIRGEAHVFMHTGEGVLSALCDLGTYRSMGEYSVALVLILGGGGGGQTSV